MLLWEFQKLLIVNIIFFNIFYNISVQMFWKLITDLLTLREH